MPRKPTLKSIKKRLDDLIQVITKETWKYCEACGANCDVGHHYYTKGSSNNLRWNMANIIPLCGKCHFSHHQKADPRIHNAVLKVRGQVWHDEMTRLQPIPFKVNMKILNELYLELCQTKVDGI